MTFGKFYKKLENLDYKTWLMLFLGYKNIKNKNGETPLMHASRDSNYEIIILLLDNGADINAKDEDGWTPLIHASYCDKRDVVELLLDNGADINATTNDGDTALDHATDREVIDLLKEYGAK